MICNPWIERLRPGLRRQAKRDAALEAVVSSEPDDSRDSTAVSQPPHSRTLRRFGQVFVVLLALCVGANLAPARAQVIYSNTTSQSAFVATGSPDNPIGTDLTNLNFGGAGTLAVSPASADKGQFQSLLMFNFAGAVSLFDSAYGTNGWSVTGISLQLTSNYGTEGVQPNNGIFNIINGGNFVIEWLADNDWIQGTGTPNLPTTDGVTFGLLPTLLSEPCENLSTNAYTPPGNNVSVTYTLPLNANLVSEIENGTNATLLFCAADNQIGYLFNSVKFGHGNQPEIYVTAGPLLEILSGSLTNGAFHLTGQGGADFQYQVQANTNLTTTNWETIGTVMANTNGVIVFDDLSATNRARFYRFVWVLN